MLEESNKYAPNFSLVTWKTYWFTNWIFGNYLRDPCCFSIRGSLPHTTLDNSGNSRVNGRQSEMNQWLCSFPQKRRQSAIINSSSKVSSLLLKFNTRNKRPSMRWKNYMALDSRDWHPLNNWTRWSLSSSLSCKGAQIRSKPKKREKKTVVCIYLSKTVSFLSKTVSFW